MHSDKKRTLIWMILYLLFSISLVNLAIGIYDKDKSSIFLAVIVAMIGVWFIVRMFIMLIYLVKK